MHDHRVGPVTKRLELRALNVDDAPAFFALNSHPEVMRFTHEARLRSLEEAIDAIARYPDFDTVGFGRWGCVLKEEQRLIGFCGLKYLDDLDAVDLGYRFLPEYWGRGLATEASLATIDFGFDVLELDRIIGLVLPDNAGSVRVLEKVGMCLEGEMSYDGQRVLQYSIHSK
jgi:RimJ/RimL family protein N-acetyltransferase